MITIIAFLAGLYLGIAILSLLVMARRNANNESLAKFTVMQLFRGANQTIRPHRARSTD